MALSLISVASVQQDAFAQADGMSMTAVADRFSDTITVTGKTVSDSTDVTLSVTSPSRDKVVHIAQVTPDEDGMFSAVFTIGPLWTEDGIYSIKAKQGPASLYTLDVAVEVAGGMTAKAVDAESSNLEEGYSAIPEIVDDGMDRGIKINADAVVGSTTITVTGSTDNLSGDITLTVTAPNGNIVSANQASPAGDGTFSSVITTGGPLWEQDGLYTVTAQQFDKNERPAYTASAEVDIKDGVIVPEFGAIAVMILVVAVISVVAISARSGLGITVPRY